jgi:hypothetical protein
MGIWDNLLNDTEFNQQMSSKGYSHEIKFTDYVIKNNLEKILQRSGAITANLLSIDFFSRQAKELVKNNMFLLRTGQGKFVVINSDFFESPYLELVLDNYEQLTFDVPEGYKHLIEAYKDRLNENASLELMHLLGVFKNVLQRVCEEADYFIGPRGNRTSKFDVYLLNKKEHQNVKIYTYNGQEELDYSIFTKNAIFVFESKSLSNGGLDVGWHKLAYPLTRFRRFSVPKFPCYFLKKEKVVWLFVFPEYKFFNEGIILNDKRALMPEHVFRIDLSDL